MKIGTIDEDTRLDPCGWRNWGAAEEIPAEIQGIEWPEIATYPEDGMGFQLFEALWKLDDHTVGSGWCLILGGLYLLPLSETARYPFAYDFSRTPSEPWEPRNEQIHEVRVDKLEVDSASKLPLQQKLSAAGLLSAYPPGFSSVASAVLPKHFRRNANGKEAFYRFSAFPNDKRVDPATGNFAPDTFAVPYSEIPLIPSGYAAVGRYALPAVFPCRHVFRNLPKSGTVLDIGAVLPNFGQAGGGVEAIFTNGAVNQPGVAHEIRES